MCSSSQSPRHSTYQLCFWQWSIWCEKDGERALDAYSVTSDNKLFKEHLWTMSAQDEGTIAYNFLTQQFDMERALLLISKIKRLTWGTAVAFTLLQPNPPAALGPLQSWPIAMMKPSCWLDCVTRMDLISPTSMMPWRGFLFESRVLKIVCLKFWSACCFSPRFQKRLDYLIRRKHIFTMDGSYAKYMLDTLGSKPLALICKGKPLVLGGPQGLDEVAYLHVICLWNFLFNGACVEQYNFEPLRWKTVCWQGLKTGSSLQRGLLRWNSHLTASWPISQRLHLWLQRRNLDAPQKPRCIPQPLFSQYMLLRKELIPKSSVRAVHNLCRVWKSWDCDTWLAHQSYEHPGLRCPVCNSTGHLIA